MPIGTIVMMAADVMEADATKYNSDSKRIRIGRRAHKHKHSNRDSEKLLHF